MRDEEFEWDDAKAATNLVRHAVSFDDAREAFADPFALDWIDDRQNYGEVRHARIGLARGRLLFVAYTMRDDRVRIISARKTEPRERRAYHADY